MCVLSSASAGAVQSCWGWRTGMRRLSRAATLDAWSVVQSAPLQVRRRYLPASREHVCARASDARGHGSVMSAYIHIPFCRRRCHYCDFPIVAVGTKTTHVDKTMADYVDQVCREIAVTARARERQDLETVFFGGGTPSLLPPTLLSRILDCLEQNFGLTSGAEVSMEMDPGTFDARSLNLFLDSGITRVSLGAQAFQESLLRKCGRAHGLQDVYDAIEVIHSSRLQNWSLDIISSLPDQTVELWEESLREAVQCQPTHISVYDLQIEPGTQFSRWFEPGQAPLPSDENSAHFYRLASKTLADAGFNHYEISNYAKPGFCCKHNQTYWLNLPYYAFGLGSTSYVDGIRFSRPRSLKSYMAFVDTLEACRSPVDSATDGLQDAFQDTIMLSLRLASGLDVPRLLSEYGLLLTLTLLRAALPFVKSGHVLVLDESRRPLSVEILVRCLQLASQPPSTVFDKAVNYDVLEFSPDLPLLARIAYLRLSDPEGFLFSNEVISSVFAALPQD